LERRQQTFGVPSVLNDHRQQVKIGSSQIEGPLAMMPIRGFEIDWNFLELLHE